MPIAAIKPTVAGAAHATGALIHDEEQALAQTLDMVQAGRVKSVTGVWTTVTAQTVCIHGDGSMRLHSLAGYAPRSMRVMYTLLPESPTIEAIILRLWMFIMAFDVHSRQSEAV